MDNHQPKKRGRQSKFTEELQNRILELAKVCRTDTEICEIVGISRESLYRYFSNYPDFSDKFSRAKSEKSLELENALVWDRITAVNNYLDDVIAGRKFKVKRRQVLDRSGNIVTLIDEEQVMPNDALIERVLGQVSPDNTSFQVVFGIADPPESEEEDE